MHYQFTNIVVSMYNPLSKGKILTFTDIHYAPPNSLTNVPNARLFVCMFVNKQTNVLLTNAHMLPTPSSMLC